MTETTGHGPALRAKRAAYDLARAKLFAEISAALADGEGPSSIARESGFTREYIAKIRDGKGPRDS
ncbi:hypothetical protein [Nocardia sp. SYP-A9097]|uniref:hypothetical protein n=1 Tax=Nocardia sp. SYP-A9097 TaxID=2663237 RepID=UPI001E39D384|nr:hypothetical protein [Nocardia sp. SYP-A9097]